MMTTLMPSETVVTTVYLTAHRDGWAFGVEKPYGFCRLCDEDIISAFARIRALTGGNTVLVTDTARVQAMAGEVGPLVGGLVRGSRGVQERERLAALATTNIFSTDRIALEDLNDPAPAPGPTYGPGLLVASDASQVNGRSAVAVVGYDGSTVRVKAFRADGTSIMVAETVGLFKATRLRVGTLVPQSRQLYSDSRLALRALGRVTEVRSRLEALQYMARQFGDHRYPPFQHAGSMALDASCGLRDGSITAHWIKGHADREGTVYDLHTIADQVARALTGERVLTEVVAARVARTAKALVRLRFPEAEPSVKIKLWGAKIAA